MAWTFGKFRGLGKKEGSGVFEDGADTPMHTMGHLALEGGQKIK